MTEVITTTITTIGVVVVAVLQLKQKRQLNRIGVDAAEARQQTTNSHQTNLRDDVDAAKAAAQSAQRSAERTEGFARDIDESVKALTHSLARRFDILQRQIRTERADRTQAITDLGDTLARHIANTIKEEP